MIDNQDQPKPVLTSKNPNKKVPDEAWSLIRDRYCAGEKSSVIAKEYGCSAALIRLRATQDKWPTPRRIKRAQQLPDEYETDDPALAIADMWNKRKQAEREDIYQNAKKCLNRFFALSPIPTSFQEAKIAKEMLDKAIDPSGGEADKTSVNLSILTQGDFSPRPVNGRVVSDEDNPHLHNS